VLDVLLRNVSARIVRDVTLTFPSSTHTAIAGPAACGASTLLALIAGTLRPESGDVVIGSRVVNRLGASKRPLLYVTSEIDVPGRWSAGHALVAAVRGRSLDREDRHHEYEFAIDRWKVLPDRRIDSLSSSERTRVQLARIELLRPAILVADRVLESANPSERFTLADELYRLLRVLGTTVISVPSATEELALADRVVVLDQGTIVQQGSVDAVFQRPASEAAALATGDINIVPVNIIGKLAESAIGEWELANPPFSGTGVALIRPDAFTIAAPGEESDFIFAVEEASFRDGAWHARGVLSGGVMLRVTFPRSTQLHKGKLLPLRVDRPATFLQRSPDVLPSRPNGATL
jgi:ABC-type Fe3+/spermidine/putrescine transport system ATPase subunit